MMKTIISLFEEYILRNAVLRFRFSILYGRLVTHLVPLVI